jgi:hypothetical protein
MTLCDVVGGYSVSKKHYIIYINFPLYTGFAMNVPRICTPLRMRLRYLKNSAVHIGFSE